MVFSFYYFDARIRTVRPAAAVAAASNTSAALSLDPSPFVSGKGSSKKAGS
jgi:hypothetical protein